MCLFYVAIADTKIALTKTCMSFNINISFDTVYTYNSFYSSSFILETYISYYQNGIGTSIIHPIHSIYIVLCQKLIYTCPTILLL